MGDVARRNASGRNGRVRRITRLAVTGFALVPLLVVGMASAASADPEPSGSTDPELSPRLLQLSELPISSDPARGADEVAAASGDLGVAETGPGSLQVDADGRVSVTVRYSSGPDDADVARLAALGIVHAASNRFGLASASVAPGDLTAVAALPNVAGVEEALAPVVGGAATAGSFAAAGPRTLSAAKPAVGDCRTVPVNLAAPLNAAIAAHENGVDGTGVTVGVISDSFDRNPDSLTTPEEDVEAGLLPGADNPCGFTTPVEVVSEATADATDEGRAMAQLVHGIAPGARILFAAAGQDELTFATAISDLADAGADVIVDDITMFSDPFFQDGPIGVSIADVGRAGVAYLSAAGNFTVLGEAGQPSAGMPISSWATDAYRPTACPAAVVTALENEGVASADCMDFDPGSGADPVDDLVFAATPADGSVVFAMQWAEPVGAAQGSFRFGLITPGGVVDLGPPNASGIPAVTGATPTVAGEYGFVIVRDTSEGSLVTPPMKLLLSADPYLRGAEYYRSEGGDVVGPTITGHAGAPQTIAVAASPYDSPLTLESFSSGGPSTMYFDYDPAVSPIASPLPAPVVTAKPDVTGVDGGFTNFFSADVEVSPGVYAFYGTSAASPAVAAVVALGKELRPDAPLESVRAALAGSAVPLASPLPDVFAPEEIAGAGLVDATGFLAALPVPVPTPTPTPVPVPAAVAAPQLAATGASGLPGGLLAGALLVGGLGAALVASRRSRRRA